MGRWNEAAEALEGAPGPVRRGAAHALRARAFSAHLQIAKGRIAEARARLERLAEAHPSSPNALWLRAQLEMLNFDAAKALDYLRRAEALAPGGEEEKEESA